jgi:tRNA(adenine34) deaminase
MQSHGEFRYALPMTLSHHDHFMNLALREAQKAAAADEVPAGCIIINTADDRELPVGAVIGRAHNQTELLRDPTAHAEMIAITQAASAIGDWRLTGTRLYVTKEPCPMCAGGIILARIPTVVYGAPDPKRGGALSVFNILDHPNMNHRCEVITGIMEQECREILQSFFRARRG